uniref:Uncharacterized protein n=1 Tax=Desertifilum tharense IPPAS B-1220 TaxID=1781255 RepID=A0ACD5GPH2_9CYAN
MRLCWQQGRRELGIRSWGLGKKRMGGGGMGGWGDGRMGGWEDGGMGGWGNEDELAIVLDIYSQYRHSACKLCEQANSFPYSARGCTEASQRTRLNGI